MSAVITAATNDYVFRFPDLTEEQIAAGLTEIEPIHIFNSFLSSSIREIIIPEGYTKIGSGVFYIANHNNKFINVRKVTLPSTLTHIGVSAFEGCKNLQTINLENAIGLKSIGAYAFMGSGIYGIDCTRCANLTTMGNGAFKMMPDLHFFYFPVRNKIKVLRECLFEGCINLATIKLPRGLKKISNSAFAYCDDLNDVKWSDTIRTIGDCAFEDCGNLEIPPDSVYSRWTSIGTDAFTGCKEPSLFENPNVFVEISAEELNSDVCAICLDSLTTTTCQLSCGHFFHQHCAHEWHRINQTCSKCRRPVTSVAIVLPPDNKRKRVSTVEEQPVKRPCLTGGDAMVF